METRALIKLDTCIKRRCNVLSVMQWFRDVESGTEIECSCLALNSSQLSQNNFQNQKSPLNFSCFRTFLSNPKSLFFSFIVNVFFIIYIYMSVVKTKFESYFRDRLTFSNADSRTSRRIYRLALLLRAPETLSSLSKSRISIFNAHLTLLVRKMTSHNSIGKYRHLVNWLGVRIKHRPVQRPWTRDTPPHRTAELLPCHTLVKDR